MVAFHIYHLHEIVKCIEGGRGRDIVHQEEGIGFEVGGSPEAAVFFLAGGVGKGEEVRLAVYSACGGVGIL